MAEYVVRVAVSADDSDRIGTTGYSSTGVSLSFGLQGGKGGGACHFYLRFLMYNGNPGIVSGSPPAAGSTIDSVSLAFIARVATQNQTQKYYIYDYDDGVANNGWNAPSLATEPALANLYTADATILIPAMAAEATWTDTDAGLAALIQRYANYPGYDPTNSAAAILLNYRYVSGTAQVPPAHFYSFDGDSAKRAVLTINYTAPAAGGRRRFLSEQQVWS